MQQKNRCICDGSSQLSVYRQSKVFCKGIAKRAAHYFIAHTALTGFLPLCDFRAPKEPVYYDSTAGACAVCGLLEIAKHVPIIYGDYFFCGFAFLIIPIASDKIPIKKLEMKTMRAKCSVLICGTTLNIISVAFGWKKPSCCFMLMAFSTIFTVRMMSFIQAETPPDLIGKIIAVILTAAICAQPLGNALYGISFEVCKQLSFHIGKDCLK